MNKSDVIKHVATEKKYVDYCKRVGGGDYLDLFHFIILELDKKTEEFLVQKFKDGSLGKYYAAMVYNNYNSKTSPYFKIYKKNILYQVSHPNYYFMDVTDEAVKDVNYSYIEKEINNYKTESEQNKYVVELFNIYLDCKSFREVERKTGIYFVTAQKTIQKFKKDIKSRCQKYLQ